MKVFYVYVMTNQNLTTLYTGGTNNLARRVFEHRNDLVAGFTQRYRCHKLVYFEQTEDISSAILRGKQIKAGSRQEKIELINQLNPEWKDLWDEL